LLGSAKAQGSLSSREGGSEDPWCRSALALLLLDLGII